MCLSLCTAYSDKQIHSVVLGRNRKSLEMFKEHCLKLERGMSAKIIVGSQPSTGRVSTLTGVSMTLCLQMAIKTSSPLHPSLSGTSELHYAFVVSKEITDFCSLRILSQLLLLACHFGLNL